MRHALALALVIVATPAYAGMDAEVDYGQRVVDFHRFTDARGTKTGMGTDLAFAGRWKKDKAPWAVGAFYSQQTFNLNADDHYFETVRVTELGLDGTIKLGDKGFVPQMGLAWTLRGRVEAQTVDPAELHKSDGGGLAGTGEATWVYDLQGVHVRPGISKDVGKGADVVLGFDWSLQTARLDGVTVRGMDYTAEYGAYAKRKTAFDSYAVVIGLRATP